VVSESSFVEKAFIAYGADVIVCGVHFEMIFKGSFMAVVGSADGTRPSGFFGVARVAFVT